MPNCEVNACSHLQNLLTVTQFLPVTVWWSRPLMTLHREPRAAQSRRLPDMLLRLLDMGVFNVMCPWRAGKWKKNMRTLIFFSVIAYWFLWLHVCAVWPTVEPLPLRYSPRDASPRTCLSVHSCLWRVLGGSKWGRLPRLLTFLSGFFFFLSKFMSQ